MTQVLDASQKLGLSFGLITTLLCLYRILEIFCFECCGFKCCKPCYKRNYYSGLDIEDEYRNMNRHEENERKGIMYGTFFGILYLMSVLNYLTEVILLHLDKFQYKSYIRSYKSYF